MGPDYQKYRDHSENVVNNLVSDMTQAYSTLYQSGIEASAQFKAMQQYETVRDEMDAASSLAALVDSPATTKAIYDQLLTGKKVASFATTDIIQREALKKLKEGRFEKAAPRPILKYSICYEKPKDSGPRRVLENKFYLYINN